MAVTTFVVPRGAEAAAVRRARPRAQVVEVRAGPAAAAALPPFDRDEVVVVLGLCGALRGCVVGDIVVYKSIVDAQRTTALDAALAASLAMSLGAAATVTACTADRVVTTIQARRALARRYDADVVDMEGTHLAAALGARGVAFAMVRVVSDDATHDIPALENAVTSAGGVDGLRIAVAFARAPRAALRFVRDVRVALRRLREVARILDGEQGHQAG